MLKGILGGETSPSRSLGCLKADLELSRVPLEFEPYYLGLESREKHGLIDFEDPNFNKRIRKPLASFEHGLGIWF